MRLFFFFISTIFLICSCSTSKDVLYMQDLENDSSFSAIYKEYRIQVDDILKIDVSSDDPQIASQFNSLAASANFPNNRESILYNGYQVSTKGNITFPSIGVFNVEGKTVRELRKQLYDSITIGGYLVNPKIDIKLVNSYFTILGEVKNPGRYDFLQNNLNIIEAVGLAGDLTINGKRNDIRLIRDYHGEKKVFTVDFTNTEFISSDNFQVFSGDIIIINPNTTRVKNAGIIGNSGTLLSLLSFILTSIIVISNN